MLCQFTSSQYTPRNMFIMKAIQEAADMMEAMEDMEDMEAEVEEVNIKVFNRKHTPLFEKHYKAIVKSSR